MTGSPVPFNMMIAHAGHSPWAVNLGEALDSLPVSVHWPRSGREALGLAVEGSIHLAVVDDELPEDGGRVVVQNLRQLGLGLPCLLVCRNVDPVVLRDAIKLDVFSVLGSEAPRNLLLPTIVRVARRVYEVEWEIPGKFN